VSAKKGNAPKTSRTARNLRQAFSGLVCKNKRLGMRLLEEFDCAAEDK